MIIWARSMQWKINTYTLGAPKRKRKTDQTNLKDYFSLGCQILVESCK